MKANFSSISTKLLFWSCVAAAVVISAIVIFIRVSMIPQMTDKALKTQTVALASTLKGVFNTPEQWTDEALSQPDLLDPATQGGKIVATLFVMKDNDFIRATTTLKKDDGSRATGTKLDPQTAAYKALISGNVYTGTITLFKRQHMATYLPVSFENGPKGAVFVGIDYSSADDMLAVANDMLLVIVLVGGLGISLLAVSLAYAIRKILSVRLNAFITMSEELAKGEGDLTVRLDDSTSKDELARIAASFNLFLGVLHEMFVEFKTKASEMGASALSLGSVVQSTNQQIQSQHDLTTQVASAIEEISVSIDEVASHAALAKKSSQSVRLSTEQGVSDLASLSAALGRTESSIDTVNLTINTFIHDVGQIDNLVTLVSEIADQTNLLALNAAIEAARAGEMGRGFAVVADEVRKLATRSNETAASIRQTTQRLSQQSGHVSGAMGSSEESLRECLACMEKVQESLASIKSLTSSLAEGSDDVANMVAEQSEAVQDIAHSMESVATTGESTANQMNIAASVADQLEKVSHNMSNVLGRFKTRQ